MIEIRKYLLEKCSTSYDYDFSRIHKNNHLYTFVCNSAQYDSVDRSSNT